MAVVVAGVVVGSAWIDSGAPLVSFRWISRAPLAVSGRPRARFAWPPGFVRISPAGPVAYPARPVNRFAGKKDIIG